VRRGDVFATDPDPALLAVTPTDVLAAVAQVLAEPRSHEPQPQAFAPLTMS
jgi:hypothetical protein